MFDTAQELTQELIEWQRGKDVEAVVPALLITTAKIAVFRGWKPLELDSLLSLLSTAFDEESMRREKSARRRRN